MDSHRDENIKENLKGYVDLMHIYNWNIFIALFLCIYLILQCVNFKSKCNFKYAKNIQAAYSSLLCTSKYFPVLNKGLQICFSVIFCN